MKKREISRYSIYRIILSCIHILALIFFISGVCILYTNDNFKKGLVWLNNEDYEDSPAFISQLDNDVRHILNYVKYRDVFETNGKFDFSKELFNISISPDEDITYNVDDVIRYGRALGYYIDETFMPVTDDEKLEDIDFDKSYVVNYKSYDDLIITEPGDAYASLDNLIGESLHVLGKYFQAYKKLIKSPCNLKFYINYGNKIYKNIYNLDEKSARSYGRYLIANAQDVIIEHNLNKIPSNLSNISVLNNYDSDLSEYKMILAVDTDYKEQDDYSRGKEYYGQQRDLYYYGTVLILISFVSMVLSMLLLIFLSTSVDGNNDKSTPSLIDSLGLDLHLMLFVVEVFVIIVLSKLLADKLIHLFVPIKWWEFSSSMFRYILIYLAFLVNLFSVLRGIRHGILWNDKLFKVLAMERKVYFHRTTQTFRLSINYILYGIINIFLLTFGFSLYLTDYTLVHRFLFLGVLIVAIIFNAIVYHMLYRSSVENDKLAMAIEEIVSGNTSYKLNLEEFTGNYEIMASKLNTIAEGLEKAINSEVKSERLKADLITNVSHDIKTPLTSIINYVDLMKRENIENETIRNYIDILEKKSKHLKNLTDNLLEASKASSGNMKVELADIDFVELIQQCNGEFEEKFVKKNLSLISNIPKQALIIVADGMLLWRVLENVYTNAYKYTIASSRVYIDLLQEGKNAVFTMKNVSEAQLNIQADELTERFVRGDISRSTEGSGLGLSIAKSLTNLQGGKFDIKIDGDLFKVILSFPLKS